MTRGEVQRWEQTELTTTAMGRDVVDGWAAQLVAVGELATGIASTPFVSSGYRGQAAAVTAAILAGREMGIGPMTALQHLYVVDGRPAMSAQLMRALVFAHGHSIRFAEVSSARVTLVGRRAGESAEATVTWTMEDARRAGLATRGNWSRYPRQMLLARATAELCRAVFPDVIGGMAYSVEEVEDMPAAEAVERPPANAKVRRASARTAIRQGSTEPAPAPPQGPQEPPSAPPPPPPSVTAQEAPPPPLPPAVGEPPPLPPDAPAAPSSAPPSTDLGAGPEEPPSDAQEPLSAAQRGKVFDLLGDLDLIEPRAARLHALGGLVGRRLDSIHQLTRAEAQALIDTLVRATETPEILDPLVALGWERISARTPQPEPLWEEPTDDPANNRP